MQNKSIYGSNGLVVAVFKVWYLVLLYQSLTTYLTYRGAYFKKEVSLCQQKRKDALFLPCFQSMIQFCEFVDLANVEEVLVIFVVLKEQITNGTLCKQYISIGNFYTVIMIMLFFCSNIHIKRKLV